MPDFINPMEAIPTGVGLTICAGGADEFIKTPLQTCIDAAEAGQAHIPSGPVFRLDQIVAAHAAMDSNRAGGKIVVVT